MPIRKDRRIVRALTEKTAQYIQALAKKYENLRSWDVVQDQIDRTPGLKIDELTSEQLVRILKSLPLDVEATPEHFFVASLLQGIGFSKVDVETFFTALRNSVFDIRLTSLEKVIVQNVSSDLECKFEWFNVTTN